MYATTYSYWFTTHLRILKPCDESFSKCIWAMNFSRGTSITSRKTIIAPNTLWKTQSPYGIRSQPLCLQGRHIITLSLSIQSRTLGSTYCSLRVTFFHLLVKQWPSARFEFTTRWSSTFPKFDCSCCHSSKLLVKVSTSKCWITQVCQENSKRASWKSIPFPCLSP